MQCDEKLIEMILFSGKVEKQSFNSINPFRKTLWGFVKNMFYTYFKFVIFSSKNLIVFDIFYNFWFMKYI